MIGDGPSESLGSLTNIAISLVIAIDIDPVRLRLGRHNALQYGVADRIEFICADFVEFAEAYGRRRQQQSTTTSDDWIDVVFLSPPWGGTDYLTLGGSASASNTDDPSAASSNHLYPLSALAPRSGQELFRLASLLSPNIAYFLPRNIDIREVADLAPILPDDQQDPVVVASQGGEPIREWVEIEEEWVDMGNKTKGESQRKKRRSGGGGASSGQGEMEDGTNNRLKAVTAYFGALIAEE